MLLDSNILIYYSKASDFIERIEPYISEDSSISAISRLEVMGYHALKDDEEKVLASILDTMRILTISHTVIDQAIALRQQKSMSAGDAIIAATSLEHGLTLVTRNVGDFSWIDGIDLVNPFEDE